MGVRWNAAYLDPTKLIALTLPETKAKAPESHATAKHARRTSRRRRG
jgi:hypothetical protein